MSGQTKYDVWASILSKKYFYLINCCNKGIDLDMFALQHDQLVLWYKKLNIQQQGDYHEIVYNTNGENK